MRKYYSLIDKVYALKNLYASFANVKRNQGAAGVDHQSIADFETNLVENINQLHEELRTKTFQPSPVRRVEIPRPDGRKRPLGIPNVRDRVVQQAILNVIQPIFEPDFHPSSYGYRPGRSCQHAVAKAQQFLVRYDLPWAVDMDLSKCFDTLDHELILQSLNRKISDGTLLKLMQWVRRRLRMKKMREWKSWKAFHKQLHRQGFKGDCPKLSMTRWRNSNCFHIDFALPNKWFAEMKLFDLTSIKTGVLFNYV